MKEGSSEEILNKEVQAKLGDELSLSMKKENRKVIGVVIAVGLFMAVAHFTPLRAWITNVQVWKAYVDELGPMADVFFIMSCAVTVMMGIPRLPLCAAAGLIFGFVEGLGLSLLGSTIGSYGAFLLTRKGARSSVQSRLAKWPWVLKQMENPTIVKVFWVRQLMVPGIVLNILFGVTDISHRLFLAGTALGYLPLNITFSLVGSGLGKGSLGQTLTQLLAAMSIINIIAWIIWRTNKSKSS